MCVSDETVCCFFRRTFFLKKCQSKQEDACPGFETSLVFDFLSKKTGRSSETGNASDTNPVKGVSVVSQIYLPIFLSETTLKSHGKGFIRKSVWKFVLEENFCQFGALEELKLKI